MKVLAVDVGGTHISCALVDDCGLLSRVSLEVEGRCGFEPELRRVAPALRELAASANCPLGDCAGVAIGFCGLVDTSQGRVLSTNEKYDDAPGIDLHQWSEREFGLPVRVENDARLALLGERYAGAARGFDDIVMLTLGTGVGGAAMVGGRLLRGRHFQAGCLGGHLPVSFEGRRCTCGAIGCVEAEASTVALPSICREWPGYEQSLLRGEARLDFAALFQATDIGDPVACAVLERCRRVWAAGAVGMVHAYDPEVLVIGGGLMRRAADLLPYLERYVREHAWTPWGKVEVRPARLGGDAALLGAVPLFEGRD